MTDKSNISDEQKKVVNRNLVDAVSNYDFDGIDLCLKKGASIDGPPNISRTPLMIAVTKGWDEMVTFILARNPNLFAKDYDSKTVFDLVNNIDNSSSRNKINKLLLSALPDASAAFSAAAKVAAPDSAVETGEDLVVGKPISLNGGPNDTPGGSPKKGFHL